MAVIKIEAKKDTRCTQTICLIRGDRRTQILRFGVNRYDGGVDLSDLAWVIKTVNANGVEDVFDPEAVEIGESRITVDWLVEGSVTDADGLAKYELNGLDTVGEDAVPVIWRGGTGTISLRADISPKFGESDGMTNIEKLILYVDGELQNVIDAGSAAADAAARANRAADNVEDLSGAVERANAAAQRATDAAAAVEDLEGAVNRANSAAALATDGAMSADMAASMAYSAASRATEAAENVENIEEATVAAYDAADDARMAAEVANTAGLPAAMIYGRRVMGETAKATGNPVTFLPDAGSLLQPVTVLEPQQEGSGDPYPAGGGRNMIPNIISAHTHYGITFTPNDDGSITVNGTNTSASAAATCIFGNIDFEGGKTYSISGVTGYEANTLQIWVQSTDAFPAGSRLQTYNGAVTRTAAASESCEVRVQVGSGVTLNNVKIYPMLAEGTDATYAPYSNIRPFVPWTELSATRSGKNLLQNTAETQTVNGITFTVNADGSVTANGTATDNTWIAVNKEFNIRAGDYIVSGCVGGSIEAYFFYVVVNNSNKISASGEYAFHVSDETTASAYIVVYSGTTISETIYPMLRLASVADPTYAPYTGTLHTVQIGQTVYGGKLDWLTGKLVAEWAMVTLTGNENISIFTQNGVTRFDIDDVVPGIMPTGGTNLNMMCSHYRVSGEPVGMVDFANGTICGYFDSSALYVMDNRFATADAYKAEIASQHAAGTPVQIAYKLAQPIEIQLTPHIISAADPEQTNTLYGDGSIEVEYVKPLHVSIEERVAAALAAAAE